MKKERKTSIGKICFCIGIFWAVTGTVERVVGWISGALAQDSENAMTKIQAFFDSVPLLGDPTSQTVMLTMSIVLLSIAIPIWIVEKRRGTEINLFELSYLSPISQTIFSLTQNVPVANSDGWENWLSGAKAGIKSVLDGNASRGFEETVRKTASSNARDTAIIYLLGLAAKNESNTTSKEDTIEQIAQSRTSLEIVYDESIHRYLKDNFTRYTISIRNPNNFTVQDVRMKIIDVTGSDKHVEDGIDKLKGLPLSRVHEKLEESPSQLDIHSEGLEEFYVMRSWKGKTARLEVMHARFAKRDRRHIRIRGIMDSGYYRSPNPYFSSGKFSLTIQVSGKDIPTSTATLSVELSSEGDLTFNCNTGEQ